MKYIYLFILIPFFFCNNLKAQSITSPNPVICGANTNAVLTASSGSTYQWWFSATEFGTYTTIAGATASTHTTATIGFYKVEVNGVVSPAYRVSNTPYAIIKNASGTNSQVNIATGQSTNLTIELFGQAPFNFTLNDNQNSRLIYSATNFIVVSVTPPTSRFFNVGNINSSCGGSGFGNNSILVNVNPTAAFTIGSIASSVCAGGVLEIPIIKTGTWDNNVAFAASLFNSSNSYIGATFDLSGDTLKYQLPTSITNGTYRLNIYSNLPFLSGLYTPFFNITNTGCAALPKASLNSFENACSQITMRPVPNGLGYTYKWYKDNNLITTTIDNNSAFTVNESGSYHVVITNVSSGYNSTSNAKTLTITGVKPLLTATNSSICGSITSTTISTTTTGAAYTYQWRKLNTTTSKYEYLVGETNTSLTVTSPGQYSVLLNDGACSNVSSNYTIASTSSAVLSNAVGNQNAVNLAPGQTENLQLTLGGVGPWTYTLSDGVNFTVKTSSVAQLTLPVTPAVATQYFVSSISSASGSGCNGGFGNGSVVVNVSPNPVLSYGVPTQITVCPGGVITIPYTLTGNVGTNRYLNVSLFTNSNTYINNGFVSGQSSNPIYYQVPATLTAGTYKFQMGANLPYISNIGYTPYTFEVVNTACPPMPQAIINSFENACTFVSMNAVPNGSGYVFQWYKDNVLVTGATSSNYTANFTGAYKVVVTNATTGYNSTSADKNITITGVKPILSSPNSSICGSNTSATISTNAIGTYIWRKYNTVTFQQDILAGQNSSSLTVNTAGQYSVAVDDGTCVTTSDNFTISTTSSGVLRNAAGNNNAVNINPGQTHNLQLSLGGIGPWTYTLYNGSNSITNTTSSSPVIIPVSPEVSRNYQVFNVSGSCGSGSVSGNVLVNVSPNPTFSFGTIATTACQGGYIEVPMLRTGNWGQNGTQVVNFNLFTSSGSIVANLGTFSNATAILTLPANLVIGNTYKISVNSSIPYISNNQFTPNFTITSTCQTPPNALINEQNSPCSFPILIAFPSGSGFTYQWKKDGVDISGQTSQTFSPQVSGNYTVNIQNSNLSYNSTSPSTSITVYYTIPPISATNTILCGTVTSSEISTSYTGANFTYTWFKQSFNGSPTLISSATSPSITVNEAGRYFVQVNNGTCTFQSNQQIITYGASGNLLNSNDNTNSVILSSSQTTENLKVYLTGDGPWEVGLFDGSKTKTYNSAISPLIIPVSPSSSTRYSLMFVSNSCGLTPSNANLPNSSILVEVSPLASFSLQTPTNNNVCRGNTIDVPFSLIGTLPSQTTVSVFIINSSSQNNILTDQIFTLEPIISSGVFSVFIPNDLALGTYLLKYRLNTPGVLEQISTFNIVVGSTNCTSTPAPIISGLSSSCTSTLLTSSINNALSSSSYTFQWYRNGIALQGKTFFFLVANETGNYTVQVINASTSYNQTSAAKSVSIFRMNPLITATNTVICGAITSSTLSGNYTGAGYTYQWYKDVSYNNGTTEQIPLFGETSSMLTTTSPGGYSIRVWDGTCLQNSKAGIADASGNLVPASAFMISPCPPCPSSLVLGGIADDYAGGTVVKEANATTGTIVASNKITNTATVTYRAGKSITLEPGFKADNGVVFKAEQGGCN